MPDTYLSLRYLRIDLPLEPANAKICRAGGLGQPKGSMRVVVCHILRGCHHLPFELEGWGHLEREEERTCPVMECASRLQG